jgi:hypothetical protein
VTGQKRLLVRDRHAEREQKSKYKLFQYKLFQPLTRSYAQLQGEKNVSVWKNGWLPVWQAYGRDASRARKAGRLYPSQNAQTPDTVLNDFLRMALQRPEKKNLRFAGRLPFSKYANFIGHPALGRAAPGQLLRNDEAGH